MYGYKRRKWRDNLSSAPSITSIDSVTDTSPKEEILPNPTTLKDCDDQLETYQIFHKAKFQELGSLSDHLRELRSQKEPLIRVKEVLHEEIARTNQAINSKSEEVTQLKHKLRHHSERQIQDNIERLEFQLRNNNYKPREEQKILDEICMLKRSFKTLKEFELKQRENNKYRAERSRLIDQRNEVFSNMQAIVLQEEKVRREMTEVREIVNSTKKTIDHIKNLRPELEKAFYEEQKQKEEARQKRLEEKTKARREQYIKRQQERQKRWEEYEASREPYEDEKDLCRMLLGYVQASAPNQGCSDAHSSLSSQDDRGQDATSCKCVPTVESTDGGMFYSKPKDEPKQDRCRGKKSKARAKKEQKAQKVKDLSHPPEVIANFDRLSISLPKTTEDIPTSVEALEQKLKYFTLLGEKEKASLDTDGLGEDDRLFNGIPSSSKNEGDCASVMSPDCRGQQLINHTSPHSIDSPDSENMLHTSADTSLHSAIVQRNFPKSFTQTSDSLSPLRYSQAHTSLQTPKSSLITSSNDSKSFFSIPVPVVASNQSSSKMDPALTPTYASVTAKIGV